MAGDSAQTCARRQTCWAGSGPMTGETAPVSRSTMRTAPHLPVRSCAGDKHTECYLARWCRILVGARTLPSSFRSGYCHSWFLSHHAHSQLERNRARSAPMGGARGAAQAQPDGAQIRAFASKLTIPARRLGRAVSGAGWWLARAIVPSALTVGVADESNSKKRALRCRQDWQLLRVCFDSWAAVRDQAFAKHFEVGRGGSGSQR